MNDNGFLMTVGAYLNFFIQRTHHIYVNVVLACEISNFRDRPLLSSNLTRDKRPQIREPRSLTRSVLPLVPASGKRASGAKRATSLSILQRTLSTFRAGDFGDSLPIDLHVILRARFRDAGTKVPACRLARRRAPRAVRRPGTSRTRRDRTPKGVTALSVARATDDRPAEGECP